MKERIDIPEKRKTKEVIYLEAARLFREKGYASSSMRDLSERTGLSPSSFYNHIRSKEDLLQTICFSTATKFMDGMERVQKMIATPREKLRELIGLHIAIAAEDLTSSMVFNDEWRHLSEPHLSQFLELRNKYEKDFLRIIEEGIEVGVFKSLDSQMVLYTFLNALRWIYFRTRPGKSFDAAKLKREMEILLLEGLSK